jgi:streptogramin lyase
MMRCYFKNMLPILFNVVVVACSPEGEEEMKQITGDVSTIAGSSVGFVDASGSAAKFNRPSGLTVDAAGNIFVTDFNNNAIRKISADGVVTTFAGGTEGHNNGTGTAAQFKGPHDIEIGLDGNFYVVEVYGNRIRKITPSGEVSNFTGSITGELAYLDGDGNAARFYSPRCLTMSADGSFYVTEFSNRIRKVTAGGQVSTFAGSGKAGSGDGLGINATFDDPMGIGADQQGNIYVAQYQSSAIRKIAPSGLVTTLSNTKSSFYWPADIVLDKQGNAFIAETGSFILSLLTPDNSKRGVSGSSSQGTLDGAWNMARFDIPYALHFDKTENIIYVSDNHRIRKVMVNR